MTEVNASPYQQLALLATENGTQIAVQVQNMANYSDYNTTH